MSAVNTCGRDLGLRQAAVVVLDALLSCLPCQGPDGREVPVSPTTLLTIYASNETLCFRAKGLTDRQLRRHIDTLEKAGLLLRRDSANGKRFPVMKGGKPVGAFGLDVSPLFAQADTLLALAHRRRQEAEELRGLRAQILRLRAACLEMQLDDTLAAFVDGLRNLVRRVSLTLIEARAALAQLTAVISGAEARLVSEEIATPAITALPSSVDTEAAMHLETAMTTEQHGREPAQVTITPNKTPALRPVKTYQSPASDGRNVRHIEPESDTKKRNLKVSQRCWSDLTEVSTFYEEPETPQDCSRIAFEFGKMLRISQELLASAVTRLGLWELLKLEDRMASQAETILSPDAYLRSVLRA